MKKLLYTLLIGCFALAQASAQSKLITQLKKQYPTADAVYIQQNKSYTLNADGSVDFHYSHQLAYLTPYAFNSQYGESFIVYNPEYQTLKINIAETLTPDGRRVSSPANAFNEVLPSNAANAPAYMNLKEMVVSHTGLETGAIVALDYVIHSKPGYSKGFFGNEVLTQASPIQQMCLDVNCSESVKLNVASFNTEVQPLTRTDKTGNHFRWQFTNLPADVNEPFFTTYAKPRVAFSSQPLTAQMEQINKAVTGDLNADIRKWVDGLVAGSAAPQEKILAIQKAVVNEINTYGVTFDQAAFRFRTPDKVFGSNGGTEVEKNVLFANLLKSQGIEAEVVAVVPAWLQKNNAENPLMVTHFCTKVKMGQKQWYLSALDNTAVNPDNSAEPVLFVGQAESELSKVQKEIIDVRGSLKTTSDNKLAGALTGLFGGVAVDEYAFLRDTTVLNSLFSGGVSAKHRQSTNGISATFNLNQTLPAILNGGYHTILLPEVNTGIARYKSIVASSFRKSLLHFPVLIDESYTYSIQPDAKWSLLDKNTNINQKTDFAEMQIMIRQNSRGGKISVQRYFKLKKQDFTPAEYRQIAGMLAVWFDKKYQLLMMK